MRAVTAKKILTQARKNARTGKVAVRQEYDRLKKEHKSSTQHPKQKLSRRQKKRKGLNSYAMYGDMSPKPKAHKWRKLLPQIKKRKS